MHREALQTYAGVEAELSAIADRARRALAGPGDAEIAFNAGPYPVDGVRTGANGLTLTAGGLTIPYASVIQILK